MFKSRSLSELKVFRHCNKDIPSSQSCKETFWGMLKKLAWVLNLLEN